MANNNKMLIDASHPEETRVVVLRGNRVEEFDFESASKKQLRGNIYLAKVIRVEPSLQAAFVDYGGNRHGFLAFAEIHPDYYQIPVADRQALLEEEARAQRSEDEEGERPARRSRRNRRDAGRRRRDGDAVVTAGLEEAEAAAPADADKLASAAAQDEAPAALDLAEAPGDDALAPAAAAAPAGSDEARAPRPDAEPADAVPPRAGTAADSVEASADAASAQEDRAQEDRAQEDRAQDDEAFAPRAGDEARDEARDEAEVETVSARGEDVAVDSEEEEDEDDDADDEEEDDEDENGDGEESQPVEQIGGDAMEEVPHRPVRGRRQYKIQEVIRRRQILLVQVVKEERGNKGAALTTYLSLAGRYSVLMPNTARGGGISRKITDSDDRKRLKAIAQELEVPDGMGVIVRTAGAARTRAEVKRDFEYLMRMWETVRETTLRSSAPTLVYEEGSLIKRAIRDLYSKEIEEILVAGDEGFREARDFMRLLMPSHARQVKLYADPQPIFARSGVEQQLDGMFSNHVTLKSGGYIVINQTEALVAIDVNSGRSTREHNIEDTALRTNLEAADEVARQLRLRDLAGLIVVDFIDMEENRNNRAVERRMKEALKNDRARIQVGRISHFGLLEMSRQRIRTGVLEGSTVSCPHCMGAGTVRSTSSIALHVLRVLEDALMRSAAYDLTIRTRTPVALYVLNQKRAHLLELEMRFGVALAVIGDDGLTGSTYHVLERGEPASGVVRARPLGAPAAPAVEEPEAFVDEIVEEEEEEALAREVQDDRDAEDGEAAEERNGEAAGNGEDADGRRRRRRRRRSRRGDRAPSGVAADAPQPPDEGLAELAIIGGDLPPGAPLAEGEESGAGEDASQEGAGEAAPREGRSRRRRRGRGGWRAETAPIGEPDWSAPQPDLDIATADAATEGQTGADAQSGTDAGETAVAAAPAVMKVAEAPPLPRLEGEAQPADAATPPAAEAPVSAPAPVAEPLPEASVDPSRPKRTGWWARARAGFGG